MSEIVATNPDMVIALLESQGARCGDGIQPRILDACPPENFCWLASEEICVYGATHDICAASVAPVEAPAVVAAALQPVALAAELAAPGPDGRGDDLPAIVIVLCVLAGVALAAKRRDHHRFPRDR